MQNKPTTSPPLPTPAAVSPGPMEVPSPPPPPRKVPEDTAGGALLGKYRLGRLLGRGSFAKVYEAASVKEGNAVAIKIIDKTKPITAVMEPQILREVAVMRKLHHHPNILKIHEVLATKSKICLVMELATGGELFSKVTRRGRLPEGNARRYFQQLVAALRFCHQNGVAHRDVKPQNLLLGNDGTLKVSDFGLSALPEQLQDGLLHTACGTPAYTAPEVVCRRRGNGYDGTKADAWSCGVILYVLLAGYLPFEENNLLAMYKRIHRRDYVFPEWMSKPARSLIHQLLDPDPNTRMKLDDVMKTSWFRKSLRDDTAEQPLLDHIPGGLDRVSVVNAFDLISLSSGLDLSGLFEAGGGVGENGKKRFTSKATYEALSEKVRDVGSKLGYRVEKGKGGSIGIGKGRATLVVVHVSEIAESLLLVEVKVVEGGVSFDQVQWGDWKAGLEEIVHSWHNEAA
ncbi:hypothetical protein MLD38_036206 [Melastoma candidum]|uniref:Uncharacterized protein n=1 Tax=Melastoma candidum TaxID=119954 RepID=A0ACB9LJ66_9MYRT|nr:hypothetical protein MLD38_036206 [Melastoma candidum]